LSLDGAGRRKEKLDAIAAHILEHGTSGAPIRRTVVWAMRHQGLSEPTARSYVQLLQEYGDVLLVDKGQRLRHINTYPEKKETATP
jgi:hypothetical protein